MRFDPERGFLRLAEPDFDLLLALHSGALHAASGAGTPAVLQERHRQRLAALQACGAITDQEAHPVLRDALTAVNARRAELNVRISGPEDTVIEQAWLLGGCAGWVRPTDTGMQFRVGAVSGVADELADRLGIGPRPMRSRSRAAIRVSRRVIDALLAGDPANRAAAITMIRNRAPGELSDWLAVLAEPRWSAWHTEMTWTDVTGHRQGRAVIVLDTSAGFLAAEPVDGGEVDLIAADPAELWRRLLRLIPSETELSQPSQ